jgi:protein SCO1/2
MARKSYLAVKMEKPSELYDMVHTENFVLVDAKKGVRGFMTVLIRDIKKN